MLENHCMRLQKFPNEFVTPQIHSCIRYHKCWSGPHLCFNTTKRKFSGDRSAGLVLPYCKVYETESVIYQTTLSI